MKLTSILHEIKARGAGSPIFRLKKLETGDLGLSLLSNNDEEIDWYIVDDENEGVEFEMVITINNRENAPDLEHFNNLNELLKRVKTFGEFAFEKEEKLIHELISKKIPVKNIEIRFMWVSFNIDFNTIKKYSI